MAEVKKEVRLPVIEIFGPTIQGEGMVMGRKTMFVRLAGCDYQCNWCDSAFTWDGSAKEEIRQLPVNDIRSRLSALGGKRFDHVTISGGNPALYPGVGELVDALHEKEWIVAVETQGSRWQNWLTWVDEVTVSPKPPSSGMKTDWPVLDTVFARLREDGRIPTHVGLKVVVFNDGDFAYAEKVHQRYPEVPFYLQAGNPDVAIEEIETLRRLLLKRLEWLMEKAIASSVMNDAYVLPQLHALVWGNRRGV